MEYIPGLYDLILQNEGLHYIDPVNNTSNTAKDFHESLDIDETAGLAFLYLDNQLGSVELLLNFLRTDFTIALLSPVLHTDYKEQLESLYRPYYIYDPARAGIYDYASISAGSAHNLFKRKGLEKTAVSPLIKLLLNTSGSTGSPKFVKLSEQNLLSNALSILDYLPVKHLDISPLNLPLFYSYGLSVFTTNSIAGGGIVCTQATIMEKRFWDELDRYQYTSIAGVPYVYEMLQRIGFLTKKYPSLRYMTQAGGKLNASVLKNFGEYAVRHNISFFSMYGQTEATARISYLPPEHLLSKLGSIGKPVRDGRLDIDPVSGELIYSGPNISGGYAMQMEDLLNFKQDEVLYTGDLAECDPDGFFYITGRTKRFIKLFGTRINLDEVEQLLRENFGGSSFLCLGEEDKYLIIAFTGAEAADKTIKQLLFDQVKIHPASIRVKQIDNIPLTPNGKTDYTAAKMMMES